MRKLLTTLCVLWIVTSAQAVKISDVTHIQGQRENRLTGIGLVMGLDGTGDGGKFLSVIRPLAAFLQHFGNPVLALDELKNTKNVALVMVTAVVGENGAREGQRIDVTVSAFGSAKSLKGGELLQTPLLGPHPADATLYAMAAGALSVDPVSPTRATIKSGATMEQDVIYDFIEKDSFTLVIDDTQASWSMASTIAMMINEAVSVKGSDLQLAKAVDPKNVKVTIPQADRASPANFISWIQSQPLPMPEKQACVSVNSRTETIVVDGNVTLSPVTIAYRGMTISTETLVKNQRPADQAKEGGETVQTPDSVELRLLLDALEYLKAPFQDRLAIIRELARSGNLQGHLIEQR